MSVDVDKALHIAALVGGVVIGVTLWTWGQPLICTCAYVKLWEGFIWSSGNSQHVADWYSLSHAVHGMLIILLGRVGIAWLSHRVLLVLAIVTGMAWEIVEHTDWVLNQFREVTVYQGYVGDSVLNSVMDYVFMWLGFYIARALTTARIAALILIMEVLSAVFGRDSLAMTTIQVVYPLELIDAYQQAINPRAQPDS